MTCTCGAQGLPHQISCAMFGRKHLEEEKQEFKHTTSSNKPSFYLIPYEALVGVANRFQLGEDKHKPKAWNALSSQEGLKDKEWIRSRVAHIIHHAYTYLQKVEGIIPDDGDDDASAITWGGMFLFEAKRASTESKV
jgi:hypothetical protein